MRYRKKRQVRLFLENGPTMEGVLVGKTADTYLLWAPKIITDAEDQKNRELEVAGHVEVPRRRVLYWQVLG